jgi:formate hydrogenlyase transcriptional activator
MEPITHSPVEQYLALVDVSRVIASRRNLGDLFHDLTERLHGLLDFHYLSVVLYDAVHHVMRLHNLESSVRGTLRLGAALAVEDIPSGWVWAHQQPLIVRDIEQDTRFPRVMHHLREHGVRSFCCLPLTTAQRRLGALAIGRSERGAYSPSEVAFAQQVAAQVEVAVDNALHCEETQALQQQLAHERDWLELLLEVNNTVVSTLDLPALSQAILTSLWRVLHCDIAALSLPELERSQLRVYAVNFPQGTQSPHLREGTVMPMENSPAGRAFLTRQPVVIHVPDPEWFDSTIYRAAVAKGFKSGCVLPLIARDRVVGVLHIGSLHEHAFTQDEVQFLMQVANQIAIAVENALAYRQVTESRERLAEEKLHLEDQLRLEHNFDEIISISAALKSVLKQVEVVAPTDSTVLIQGETGTGKELIARAIHQLSARRDHSFVKVNCAAIPLGLLESELFGHERGAFTGAIAQKVGRFELAHKGTLFLDEIGDIPLELQPKLLRVLQEQEFERLGSTRTLGVDVRLVAATNRDLAQMVEDGKFREDLYYRLNVFPIIIPPLRERAEDIPLLARHFVNKYAQRMRKHIDTIPAEALDALTGYHWPGNVRELQNVIERAVILTPDAVLRLPPAEWQRSRSLTEAPTTSRTLEDVEREHILQVLRDTKWVISGPHGAAVRLGLRRTTLIYRMEKLGIPRRSP